MNLDRINEYYFGDPADPATERARQRIHWMCSQAVGHDVLDIGCSQGILSLILGREGFRCVGIDIEATSLDVARKALAQEDQLVQQRVAFQVVDASTLPCEDDSFDTVVLGEILEHLAHPDKVLSEAKRVLRDNGRLIVTVPYGLNAFHDHKCTYYPISLLELLQPHFKTHTIDTLGSYIIYTGSKDPSYDPTQLSAEILFDVYLRLARAVQSRCLEKERALFETGRTLHAKIKTLTAQVTEQRDRIKDLGATIAAKEEQHIDVKITSQRVRELVDMYREAASHKEQALHEATAALHAQTKEFTAQMAADAGKLGKLEQTLAVKDQQLLELKYSTEKERELAAIRREAAAQKEQELLETSTKLHEQVVKLREQAVTQASRLEKLERTLSAKEQQIHELQLSSAKERELAATQRDVSAAKEHALLEKNTTLRVQLDELMAQGATLARKLQELEETIAAKEQQIQELKLNAEEERELADKRRALAAANAARDAEQEQLQSLKTENARMRQELSAKDIAWQERLDQADSLHADRLRARERYFQEVLANRAAEENRKSVNQRIRDLVRACLPADAHVLVISRGDDDMLRLDGRHGSHFPQEAGGVYAGYHPADAADAVAHLETLKAKGAEFLLIPGTSMWWLEYYEAFRQHLESSCSIVLYEETACAIYALRPSSSSQAQKIGISARNGAALAKSCPESEAVKADAPTLSSLRQQVSATSANGADRARLGAILDEFTTGCLSPECRLITFRPDNWRSVLERQLPDAIFVESAWRGNDGAWQYRIANYTRNMGNELDELLRWAEHQKIPTVFWNKEDPVHFDRFIERARLFSYVFTTDANCVPRYRERLGHDRVFALPFAAQPAIHNPIQDESREGSVCFAGTYHASRYAERQADMEYVLRPAIPFTLEIYNRQHGMNGKSAEKYRFPDIYQSCIKGRLDYDEMVKAYKRYRVFLNVNSVKQSPTMFSRRVFELLACGTPVISTYSHGIVELLGEEVVFFTESEADTRRHLERLLGDEDEWARASARGIRKVMSEHTYGDRLTDVFEHVGLSLPALHEPRISVVVYLTSESELNKLAALCAAQCYRRFNLILISEKAISAGALEHLHNSLPGIPISNVVRAVHAAFQQSLDSAADYLAFLDMRDSYGPNYLFDYALAMRYANAEFIGKHTFYKADASSERQLTQAGHEFKYVSSVQSASLLARKSALSKELFIQALSGRVFQPGGQVLSVDRFNYLQNALAGGRLEANRVEATLEQLEFQV